MASLCPAVTRPFANRQHARLQTDNMLVRPNLQVMRIDSAEAIPHMPLVLEQVLLALARCHGDIMIANEAVETVETVSKIPQCLAMTSSASTPLILSGGIPSTAASSPSPLVSPFCSRPA